MQTEDTYVTNPGVRINKRRTAVEFSFDLMDPNSFQSIGSGPRLRMTSIDTMKLLTLLAHIQEKYRLPAYKGDIEHTDMPPKAKRH